MRHQPFETWIIDQAPLDPPQVQALKSHLQQCESCRRLSAGWSEAQACLLSVTARPAPRGFTQRFTASLAQRRYAQQQSQLRRTVLFLIGGSLLSLLALLAYLIFTFNPIGLFMIVFHSLTYSLVWWNHLQANYLPLIQSLPVFVPIALWIAFTTSLCVFSCIWVFSIWRISTQGVPNK